MPSRERLEFGWRSLKGLYARDFSTLGGCGDACGRYIGLLEVASRRYAVTNTASAVGGGVEPSSTQEESEVTAARASTLCYLINDYRSQDTTIHKESGQQYEQRKDGNQILQH